MNFWSWIFFPRSKVFDGLTIVRRLVVIFHMECRTRFVFYVHDLLLFPACDWCTNHLLFVCNPCAICVSFCTPREHDVFIGPGFEPLYFQCDHFVGPGFDSWVRLPMLGQWNPWPMSNMHCLSPSDLIEPRSEHLTNGYGLLQCGRDLKIDAPPVVINRKG
jgi:hypothetical protein